MNVLISGPTTRIRSITQTLLTGRQWLFQAKKSTWPSWPAARESDILCVSGDLIGDVLLRKIVEVWLSTDFSGGRHKRRVNKIAAIEEGKDPRGPQFKQ
jgi:hypothetical protein